MINEIQEIIDKNITVTEKLTLLNKCKNHIEKEFDDADIVITQGYKYCPLCKQFYRELAWGQEFVNEKRMICVSSVLAEWDDEKYEEKDTTVLYDICPVGHRIIVDITY